MGYRVLADLLVVVHLGFVVFVVLGGFLVWRWRHVIWVHLPAALWGTWIEFAGWICPLTPLENRFRRLAGATGYEGGFVEHYLIPVLYPEEWTLSLRVVLGSLVVAVNVAAYGLYFWRRRNAARGPDA